MESKDSAQLNPETASPNTCANCGSSSILKEFPTKLCYDCRQQFINFPIPLWIKGFAGIILLLVISSTISSFKNLSLGLHLERGLKAEKNKKFLTAQNEFSSVLKKVPENLEAKSHLMIAAFYNEDLATFGKMLKALENEKFEDEGLYNTLDNLILKAGNYYSSDSFNNFLSRHISKDSIITKAIVKQYLDINPEEINVLLQYANLLYDDKNYTACDSVIDKILLREADLIPALQLLASSKRETGQWEKSFAACDKILSINKEAAFAVASKARTLLKQYKDREALDMVLQSLKINDKDNYCIATLALAYHFNGKIKERDKILNDVRNSNDSSAQYYLSYPISIIKGKEIFRK